MSTVIGIVVFPDVQLLDVAGPFDVFSDVDGIEVRIIAQTREAVMPFALTNASFIPQETLEEARPDVLLVPGGAGVRHLLGDAEALAAIAKIGTHAQFVTSVCTGGLVLGAAGLLSGYHATTHWRYLDLLDLVGAIPSKKRVVVDRNRITAGGVTAGIDFGLALLAKLSGEHVAMGRQLYLQYDPEPPFNAGVPETAPPQIVEEERAITQERYDQRAALLIAALR